jgi:opacity protein-like surface antigen
MKFNLLTTTALISALAIAPAAAQAPPVFTWTGFYAGLSFGYASMRDRATHEDIGSGCWWSPCSDIANVGGNGRGVIGGIQGGYNHQIGSVVFGAELDISTASARANYNQYYLGSYFDYSQRGELSAIGSARGRFGFAFDRAFVYATGGLAFANVKNHVQDNDDPGLFNVSKWRYGGIVGAGIEYALSDVWSVKAEGLYYSLNKSSALFRDLGRGGLYRARFKNNGVIARVGLNYKFGAPATAVMPRY